MAAAVSAAPVAVVALVAPAAALAGGPAVGASEHAACELIGRVDPLLGHAPVAPPPRPARVGRRAVHPRLPVPQRRRRATPRITVRPCLRHPWSPASPHRLTPTMIEAHTERRLQQVPRRPRHAFRPSAPQNPIFTPPRAPQYVKLSSDPRAPARDIRGGSAGPRADSDGPSRRPLPGASACRLRYSAPFVLYYTCTGCGCPRRLSF